MIRIDYVNAKKIFDIEVNNEKQIITELFDEEESKKRLDAIDKKYIHTFEVVQDGIEATKELGFNESTTDFTRIALMDHDIGRFAQMRHTGNYNDVALKEQMGVKNHGELGKQILETKVIEQLPNIPLFHEPIKTIVNNHVDRLDIYHQILDDRWTPMKVEDEINPLVFEMFYNGEYLNMAELRQQGLWNANVGELVRLGFINQIKLLSVAKVIQKENIIMRLKDKRQNPKAKDAFDYANEKLKQMIENSTDGVTLKKIK